MNRVSHLLITGGALAASMTIAMNASASPPGAEGTAATPTAGSSTATAPTAATTGPGTATEAGTAPGTATTPLWGTPVDVVVHDRLPPHRLVVVEWNPLALLAISKLSANVIVTPDDHHALVLNPFYASTTTAPIAIFDDTSLQAGGGPVATLPKQKFSGFGIELGYRYYWGEGGPRGFFVGPSLILGSFTAAAQDGSKTSYLDYGLAGDAGYQMLVADRVALSLGAGAQYVVSSKSIPDQQFPAWIYANTRVSPRVLFSLGWAL